jgi:hypothetical protein
MRRLNTSLAAQGAEFLVLGQLLVRGIPTYKAYVNHPAYDLLAVAETGRTCRISVKSRYASDYDGGFPLKSLECDFIVFVALNQGNRYYRKGREDKPKPADYFVLPVEVLRAVRRNDDWQKVFLRDIEGVEQYRERWDLIADFVGQGD